MDPDFRPLIETYLNGNLSDELIMVKLMAQVIAVLIAGLVLWKISGIFNRKKNRKRRGAFMESRFQEHWKNR